MTISLKRNLLMNYIKFDYFILNESAICLAGAIINTVYYSCNDFNLILSSIRTNSVIFFVFNDIQEYYHFFHLFNSKKTHRTGAFRSCFRLWYLFLYYWPKRKVFLLTNAYKCDFNVIEFCVDLRFVLKKSSANFSFLDFDKYFT